MGAKQALIKDQPVAVDLFAGAGGLAEGLLSAGVHVACAVELHPQAALTHAFNHPGTKVLVGDIRDLDLDVLSSAVSRSAGHAPVDIVVGGPPCQGFSSAGKKSFSDPRNSLFINFVKVIEYLQPRMFLMENVPGFKTMYQGRIYAEACEAFNALGYKFDDITMVAADHGVPQRRKRFVMVGWHANSTNDFHWPEPSNSLNLTLFDSKDPQVTAAEALDDMAFLEPGFEAMRYPDTQYEISEYAQHRRNGNKFIFNHLATRHRARAIAMFEQIPPGKTIRQVDSAIRSGKVTLARIDPSRIANTVLSLPDDMLHYAHNRILTVREMARLQTFDDDFVFLGKRTSGFVERRVDVPQYTQVGNAVPPLLGRALGSSLIECLGGEQVDLRDLKLRRARHLHIRGSSGYAGYTLDPAIESDLELLTVTGESIPLPVSLNDKLITDQEALRDWTKAPNPRRGQWAPGISPKEHPSWVNTNNVTEEV